MEGRSKLFESFTITIASVINEYSDKSRDEAPDDSNRYFEEIKDGNN